MKTVRMKVQGGKLVGDAPPMFVDGAIVDVIIADEVDDMSAEELAELNDSLDASWAELEAGQGVPAREVLAEIRALRPSR